jgi:hypothetical protein
MTKYYYIDPLERKWDAPRGSIVNGADIPMEFWSIAGGPFEGKYRKASVLHDVACQVKKQTWRRVHRMFFDAMMCEGLPLKKALALYGAVYHFGPQWDDPEGFFERVGGVFANLYGICGFRKL